MVWNAEFVAGFVLAAVKISNVFPSILVPGPPNSWLRFASPHSEDDASALALDVCERQAARAFQQFRAVAVFVRLYRLDGATAVGFALMLHASAGSFTPRLCSFGEAAYVSGALTEEECGAAVLMDHSGSRMAAHLCELSNLKTPKEPISQDRLRLASGRLEQTGYPVRHAARRFASLRADYDDSRLKALAKHFGSQQCLLIP